MIVSKLNAVPFHRVNSPLLEPASSRRPSGVHRTMLTECLTLLVDSCRYLQVMDSAAERGLAIGGRISIKEMSHREDTWKAPRRVSLHTSTI